MARVILVRHGQTEWNRIERFRGRIDIDLNETGIWQAGQAAKAVKERYAVSAIYSSPLSRARRTAEAIGRSVGLPVQILPALIDFSYGEWEGKSLEEVEAAYPELYHLWETRPHQVRIPGGESLRRVRTRVSTAVQQVAAAHPNESVVLVSHRIVCKVLACSLLGLPISHLHRLELDTASLSLFEQQEAGWVTLRLNDTCHLPGDEKPPVLVDGG